MNCFPNTWTTFCKFGYFYQFLPVSHQREIFLVVLKQKLFFKCNKISFPMESSYKILIILNCQPLLLKGRVSFVLEFEACHASACPRTMERGEVPSYSHSISNGQILVLFDTDTQKLSTNCTLRPRKISSDKCDQAGTGKKQKQMWTRKKCEPAYVDKEVSISSSTKIFSVFPFLRVYDLRKSSLPKVRRCCCWSLEDLDFGGNFDVQLIGVDATVCLTCCLTSSGVFTFVTWKKSLGSSISLIVLLLIGGARICFESRKVCGYVVLVC